MIFSGHDAKGKFKKGHIGYKASLGKPLSEETKEKLRVKAKEKWQNPEYRAHMVKAHIGKMCGKDSPSWKGGITPVNIQIRHCFKYRQWRSDVFTRDNFTCQNCLSKGVYLHAHHIKAFSLIIKENNIKSLEQALNCEELWNINNGMTLCRECHELTDNYKKHK